MRFDRFEFGRLEKASGVRARAVRDPWDLDTVRAGGLSSANKQWEEPR
jgi:hypothetical protein